MNPSTLFDELIRLHELERRQRIEALGNSHSGNEDVISTLLNLLQRNEDEITNWFILRALGKIAPGHDRAIQHLLQILQGGRPPSRLIAAEVLPNIANSHEPTIHSLVEALTSATDEQFFQAAISLLGKIAAGNTLVSQTLIDLIYNSSDNQILSLAAESLYKIDPGSKPAIDAWLHLIRTGGGSSVVKYLAQTAVDNAEVITNLKQMMRMPRENDQTGSIRTLAARVLEQVNRFPGVPNPFYQLKDGTPLRDFKAAETAFYASIKPDTIDEFLALLKAGGDEYFLTGSLAKIGIGDDRVFNAFVALLDESQRRSLRRELIIRLLKIVPGISDNSKQLGIQVVNRQLEISQWSEEKARLAGLLGALGGATQATVDLLAQMIDQEPPTLDPERLQKATQQLQAAGLSEEQIAVSLASMTFPPMPHDQRIALYNLGLIQGEVDGIERLLTRLRMVTSLDELATILATLRKHARDRPEVAERLCEIVQTATDPELYGTALWGLIDLGGDNPDVITMMNHALAARSDYAEALVMRASIYEQRRQPDRALEDCDQSISLNPDDVNPWFLKSKIFFEQERYAESIAVNQQVLQLQPDNWSAWYNLACCYAKQNDLQAAIVALESALALSPSDVKSAAIYDPDLGSLSRLPEFQQVLNNTEFVC